MMTRDEWLTIRAKAAQRSKRFLRPDCKHLGKAILSGQAAELGLDTRRTWKPCALGHGEKGHVCGCKPGASCRGCPDYSPG